MSTISLHVTRIDAGAQYTFPSTTSSAVIAVMQGDGTSEIGGETFRWSRGDAMAFPSGTAHRVKAETEAYILRATDEPIFSALGWLREVPVA